MKEGEISMQLYIHIPFCEKKCSYCRFASIWSTQDFLIEKYVRYLCREISAHPLTPSLVRRGESSNITTIYFWGWTPGVLTSEQLESIFTSLKKQYIFSENIEITLETTPNHVTRENIYIWKQLWVNRISMWIQTLNEKSLDEIGRGGKWDIEKALEVLKWWWITNVSVDFILWLPYVAKWETLEDIKYIQEKYSFITHISVYMLEDYYSEDKVIETWFDKKTYPDNWDRLWLQEEDFLEEYSSIKNYLKNKWFERYEVSNFAKPWYECKHNKWYWGHAEVRAFGLGAYWFEDNIRYANSESFSDYYSGKRILEEAVTPEEFFTEKVMFWLRTDGLWEDLCQKLNQEKLGGFLEERFLEKKSDRVVLSDKGVMVMDHIMSELI